MSQRRGCRDEQREGKRSVYLGADGNRWIDLGTRKNFLKKLPEFKIVLPIKIR